MELSEVEKNTNGDDPYESGTYRKFWDGTARFSLDKHEHKVLESWLPKSGRRILDAGCGYGRLSDSYLDRFRQSVLFDSSISLLRQAYDQFSGHGWYVAGDINHMPFRRGSFDHILMIRVLHHLPDLKDCLLELQRVVCMEGKIIFTYSNKRNFARMAGYLLKRDPLNPFTEETISLGPTLIRHHPKYVRKVLTEMGYTRIDYRGVGVIDKIAGKIGDGKLLDSAGGSLAPFLGRAKLAPWVFCQFETPNKDGFIETDCLDDILICPSCQGEIMHGADGYVCEKCAVFYPIKDGIADFRPK